jgi:membrane protein implicated in regulation of membrane protease activity
MDWIALAWVVIGILIILTELLVTGVVAVFFGIGAIVTGIAIALGLPGTGATPFVLFSGVSISSLVLLRRRFSSWFKGGATGDGTGGVGDDFIGRDAQVTRGFGSLDQGRGEVDFRGASWAARSDHQLAEGAFVVITGRDNLTLIVAPQES